MAKQIRCYRVEVVNYPYNTYYINVIGTKTQVEAYCKDNWNSITETYYYPDDYMVYGYRPFLHWIGSIAVNHRSPNSPWYDGPFVEVLDDSVDLDDAIRAAKLIFTGEELR